jgi:hypothetical protein
MKSERELVYNGGRRMTLTELPAFPARERRPA